MGFTLIELVIVAAIIALISAIVLVRFNTFDSTVVLKSVAYDVASSIRDAQIYSISVVGESANFKKAYGVNFSLASASERKQYIFFREETGDDPAEYSNVDSERVGPIAKLPGTIEISELCVVAGVSSDCNSYTTLNVSFLRPEFDAIYHTGFSTPANINEARIKLYSTNNPTEVWMVRVYKLGQISVCKEGTMNCP